MKAKLDMPMITSDYGATILRLRGVKDVTTFVTPNHDCLQSWHDLENIDKGISLIEAAMVAEWKVGLLVDCDADGYTSSAIIYQYMKRLGIENITYFIHTAKQHGLEDTWEEISDGEFDLLVIPDAGSNDWAYIEKFPCPVLILDHHIFEADSKILDNMVLINNQTSPKYLNKDLSGAGVVFQFCRALDEHFKVDWAYDYIDLAAVGVDGDMMSSLRTENQYIWRIGFNNIQNKFLRAICEKQSYSMGGDVNPTSVAFYVVPLINAMIRYGTYEEKERMFLAFIDGDQEVVSHKRGAHGALEKVAIESVRECTNAKKHQDDAKVKISENLAIKIMNQNLLDNKILFIRLEDDDDFPAELNGLICMQLAAKYNRPTLVGRLNEEGIIKGSARNVDKSALTSLKDFLNNSGYFDFTAGHDNAFGFAIKNSRLGKFHEYANEKLKNVDFSESCYDVQLMRQGMSEDLVDIAFDLNKYKFCWGSQNKQPLILITNIHVPKKDIVLMGKNQDTIKFTKNGISYIKFRATKMIDEIAAVSSDELVFDIVGSAQINSWMGNDTPQYMIDDYEIHGDSLLDF